MVKLQDQQGATIVADKISTNYEAYLYDCDGTLASTMTPHKAAWVQEIKNHGFDLSPSLIDELAGMPAIQTVEVMNQRFGWGLDPAHVAKSKEQLFLSQYVHLARPIPLIVDHLKSMAALGKKIAVVSGGRTKVVLQTLQILGVSDLVHVVICAEDVKIGKPHPEPFLLAAEKLGVAPSQCLVFEDAEFGIQSAKAAGMDWIRVTE